MALEVRKIQEIGSTILVSIPLEFGFKKGELVKVEKLDDQTVKVTKLNGK